MEILDFLKSHIALEHLNFIFILGLILFAGTSMGRLFQKWKIPQVVGYIIMGVILGKTGFALIDSSTIASLEPFSSFALGLIGFMIGGELKIKTMKKFGRQFATILLLESFGAFVIVSIVITLFGMLLFHDIRIALSLGLLMGAISSATAPAATTDVLWENKTRGPLTTMVLGIVAMDDGVALLLFAIASSVAGILSGQAGDALGVSLLKLLWEVGAAVGLGLLAGLLIRRVVRSLLDDDKILAFSIGAILLLIGFAQILNVDLILATMSMGFFIGNYVPKKSARTFKVVEKFTPPVYILFFVMVGANVDVSGLSLLPALMAVIYILGRITGKALGSVLGASLSKAPRSVRRYLPFCLLSQAGVAIGLSIVAGHSFKGPIGDTIILVVTATTFVVQLLGPAMVKYAVTRAEEVGLNITESDLIEKSHVRDIVDLDIPKIRENQSIPDVLKIFAERDNYYYPVVNSQDELTGILSIDKLKDSFIASDFTPFLLAHDIMEKVGKTCTMDMRASEIYDILKKQSTPSVPVVDEENRVQGMIEYRRVQQLISRKMAELQAKARQMEEM